MKYTYKEYNPYFVRWSSECDKREGEFWYIIKDTKEDLNSYKSKIRNQIKKGLKNCQVKQLSLEFIQKEGYEVYKNSFNRYKNSYASSKDKFLKTILDKEYQFWGVFIDEKLVGYAQNFIQDEVCHYLIMKFEPKYMRYYSSYALIYEMNKYYLNEKNCVYVSDGSRAILHQTNIQEFLIKKFKFRKMYCKLHISYRKDIWLLVNILYPFRKFLGFNDKLKALLMQEEIRRNS